MSTLGLILVIALQATQAEAEPLDQHMVAHFAAATQIQTAVIEADLPTARERARWLAEHPMAAQLPEDALADLALMRSEAGRIALAGDLESAARATARMAVACGACHALMQVKTGLDSSQEGPIGHALKARMDRHLWAADRLWEGLIAPSDDAWQRGAAALLEAPLTGKQLTGRADEAIDAIGAEVRSLGRQALGASNPQRQSRLYGQLLSACAGCHLALRSPR